MTGRRRKTRRSITGGGEIENVSAKTPRRTTQTNSQERGTSIAKRVAGQERRLVDPPSQVVAGVRTVTTKNEWARAFPSSRPFDFSSTPVLLPTDSQLPRAKIRKRLEQ